VASFEAWKVKYGKSYDTTEAHDAAFLNFAATARRVMLKNLAQSRAGYKVGIFADLSPEQFRAQYLNLDAKKLRSTLKAANLKVAEPAPLSTPIPDDYDWATINNSPVTYVKDQGQCGSCWTFSVTETLESFVSLKQGKLIQDLSEQQIVDCDNPPANSTYPDQGCNGGFTQGAWEYIMKTGGLESEDSYPYTSGDDGASGPCQFDKTKIVPNTGVANWQYAVPTCDDACTNQNSTLLLQQLYALGPLSICVVATDDWQDYSWGVLIGYCPMDAQDINHGVQLTGYANGKNEGWYIIRNSWSDQWGNDGYIWVDMPNDCGVADIVTYPTLA